MKVEDVMTRTVISVAPETPQLVRQQLQSHSAVSAPADAGTGLTSDSLLAIERGGVMTRANQRQRAKAGDLIVIEGNHVGDTKRTGEIVEVLGDPEHEHYRVRWDDRESIFYPGGGEATIKHQTGRR